MCIRQFCDRAKVASRDFGCRFLRFATGSNQLANALIGLCLNIIDMRIWLERSAIDAEVGDGAHLCRRSFEDEHGQSIIKGFCVFR